MRAVQSVRQCEAIKGKTAKALAVASPGQVHQGGKARRPWVQKRCMYCMAYALVISHRTVTTAVMRQSIAVPYDPALPRVEHDRLAFHSDHVGRPKHSW